MKRTITAIYETHTAANQVLDKLLNAGFDAGSISVMMSKATHERFYTTGEATAAWGAGIGAVLGGLTALAVAPPFGLFVAGPLLTILGGTAVGAAGGGLLGGLLGLGVPEDEARRFERQLEQGGVVLAVETEGKDRALEAERIMLNTQAPISSVHVSSGADA